jgi:hypothetical protein
LFTNFRACSSVTRTSNNCPGSRRGGCVQRVARHPRHFPCFGWLFPPMPRPRCRSEWSPWRSDPHVIRFVRCRQQKLMLFSVPARTDRKGLLQPRHERRGTYWKPIDNKASWFTCSIKRRLITSKPWEGRRVASRSSPVRVNILPYLFALCLICLVTLDISRSPACHGTS